MGQKSRQAREVWALARRQYDVIARRQLLEIGFSSGAITHRLANGRLHPLFDGVYAVGRPDVSREGVWMAAVLACGPDTFLSHGCAGELRGLSPTGARIEVTIRGSSHRGVRGITIHRRPTLPDRDFGTHRGIPVTSPLRTLLDLATRLAPDRLEALVNDADRLDLVDPESLRAELAARPGERGVRPLRAVLDRHTYRLTESELERRFLRLVRAAGLPLPRTQARVNGYRADFFWPELGLVVETDGLRYHRTAARQALDNRRARAHVAA